MPAFRKTFGKYVSKSAGYQIPANWQTANGLAATIGSFFSIIVAGTIANRIGYRWTGLLGLALMIATIFVPFFAPNLPVFFVGELLVGHMSPQCMWADHPPSVEFHGASCKSADDFASGG